MFANASILVTGGTGSFGRAFVGTLLKRHPEIKRLVVFSRDELKQFEMSQIWSERNHKGMRYFLGDVRDGARLSRALEGIDFVVHAAALKQVVAAEYNPFEFVQTNIIGANNVINACLEKGVKRVVALSTDKAAAPINLYGATKLCSDKLFVSANNIRGARDLRFSVVRYGNVMGSRGSVIPFFLEKRASGVLPITSTEMTRFNISLQEGVDMVLWSIENAQGGEIFVPKIPSYRITDVAEAVAPECRQEIVGIRPGEKVHEEMITVSDGYNAIDLKNYFAILPTVGGLYTIDDYCTKTGATRLPRGFSYNSGSNPEFLTVAQIRDLIRRHLDHDFRA
jgi:UDP-N-acetylglucosamine 4,6-dehydratase (inverting)